VLALKLTLVPALLLALTLAGMRWGPGVAGWLTGLPAVAGPILLFLAIERGTPFAAQAAVAAMAAVLANVAFLVAYSRACLRLRWPGALLAGLLAWALAAAALARLPVAVPLALVLALAGLLVAPRLLPPARAAAAGRRPGAGELALRMAAGAGLTVAVTLSAAHVGTAWSGLLTAFPVLTLVMATFSHRTQGADFVVALQRATVGGLYAFVAFCATLAFVLGRGGGITTSFAAAIAATVAVQWLTRRSAGARPAVAGTPPAAR
jgi:uncharacterized membrane protein (GlpM family)